MDIKDLNIHFEWEFFQSLELNAMREYLDSGKDIREFNGDLEHSHILTGVDQGASLPTEMRILHRVEMKHSHPGGWRDHSHPVHIEWDDEEITEPTLPGRSR